MYIIEIQNKVHEEEFIKVNVKMNASNPCYIRPLNVEVKNVFNPKKNKLFQYGEAKRWLLKNNSGQLLGRIAAFTNTKYKNKGTTFATGCIGFFDCINNQHAANILFNTAKEWLKSKGMQAIDGPVNFGDRDKWWGLMVEGFNKPPAYGMSFNPPYYEALFEQYGFKNYYNQYYYALQVSTPLPPRFEERHARFKSRPEYRAEHIKISQLEKYAHDFVTVYNMAWAQHQENKEISFQQAMRMFKTMRPIMDARIIWFAYYKNEPIAMWINIPDLNEYFKHFNGKFGWREKLQLMMMKRKHACKRFLGVAFGIVPKFQGSGIDSFMIQEASFIIQRKHLYDEFEMGWAADWNPKMINIYKSLGGTQSRRMVTYRYLIDSSIPFERHPIIE